MSLLCTVLKKAVQEGLIPRDPTVSLSIPRRAESDTAFLSADEVKRLAAVVPEKQSGREVYRAFLFSCFTGLRVSDIETLNWRMIELNPPQIIKRQKKTKASVFIPLNKSAWKLINDGREHDPDEAVFSLCERRMSYCFSARNHQKMKKCVDCNQKIV